MYYRKWQTKAEKMRFQHHKCSSFALNIALLSLHINFVFNHRPKGRMSGGCSYSHVVRMTLLWILMSLKFQLIPFPARAGLHIFIHVFHRSQPDDGLWACWRCQVWRCPEPPTFSRKFDFRRFLLSDLLAFLNPFLGRFQNAYNALLLMDKLILYFAIVIEYQNLIADMQEDITCMSRRSFRPGFRFDFGARNFVHVVVWQNINHKTEDVEGVYTTSNFLRRHLVSQKWFLS